MVMILPVGEKELRYKKQKQNNLRTEIAAESREMGPVASGKRMKEFSSC
jgi:hypothetical protein